MTDRVVVAPGVRRAYAILTGITTLFVFVQFFTSGEFIGAHGDAAESWKTVHGLTAYGLLVPALLAAVLAVVALRRAAPVLTGVAVALLATAVGQTATGQLISGSHLDGLTPFHVLLAAAVLSLAVWASIRSAALRRG